MDNQKYSNIKTVLGAEPNKFDVAIAPISQYGGPGTLNIHVLSSLDYDVSVLNSIKLTQGYYLLSDNLVPVVLVVTIGKEKTGVLLEKNLTQAIEKHYKEFIGKDVWIPLMGTGAGDLEFIDSYDITVRVLTQFEGINFTIAIPDDTRGREFVKAYDLQIEKKSKKINEIEPTESILGLTNKQLFLASHLWGKEDQMDRFHQDGIWENGHDTNDTSAVNSAKEDDLVFIKSTYSEKGKSILRIKGVGIVVQNPKDGHLLRVNWSMFDEPVNIDGLGKYRRTFQRVMPNDRELVLKEILHTLQYFGAILDHFDTKFTPNLRQEVEVPIDVNEIIVFSRKLGTEIRKYTTFFILKDSSPNIGKNSYAYPILTTLGLAVEDIRFDTDFLKTGYRWMTLTNSSRAYRICFVFVPNETEFSMDFSTQLENALTEEQNILLSRKANYDIGKTLIALIPTKASIPAISSILESIVTQFPHLRKIGLTSELQDVRIHFSENIPEVAYKEYADRTNTFLQFEPHPDLLKNLKELTQENEEEEDVQVHAKDKIPFHLDNVETIDKLNREPVAKSLARLINKDIFDQKEMNHSFMVHLQGEWGSGKSTFLNLIEKHLDTDKRKWIVVKYNAWQNQHISPPWWSLIDQIYRQGKQKLHWFTKRPMLWSQEKMRRWLWYSAWQKITSLGIFVLLLIIISLNHEGIFKAISTMANLGENSNDATVLKFIMSIASIIGLVFSFAKFISTPIAMQSSEQAKRFTLRASDPMNRIKEHFNGLLGDFNKQGYEVAVFIDDIDRCNRAYTIELLEGIQTLFKDRRVLYIVAGDTKWITSCFENNYKEFSSVAELQGQNLGELFLEKAFQLSVRMPDVSEASKADYWKEIIGDTIDIEVTLEAEEEITAEKREEIKQRLVVNYNENENSAQERSNIEQEYNISGQQATDMAIEALDENTEDVRHLLLSFHSLISPNPRSIKRLANNYSMYRNTLIAEQTDFKPGHLFRWLLLEDKYPMVVKHFLETNTLESLQKFIDEKVHYTAIQIIDLNAIINGREDLEEGALLIEELNQILRK